MYLQIKKAQLTPDKFGNRVEVTMIGLYEDNGKWVKWVKLNDAVLEELLNVKINYFINPDK